MPSWVSRDSIAVGLEVQSTPFRSATGQQTAKDANRTADEQETNSEQEQRLAYYQVSADWILGIKNKAPKKEP